MSEPCTSPLRVTLALFAAALLPGALAAQSPYLGREPVPAVWAEFLYPVWDDAEGYSAYLLNVGGRLAIGTATSVIVEVPMATSSDESGFGDDGFALGNPYLGLRHRSGATTAGLGVRFPLMADDAPASTALGGILGDFERFEAYAPDVWTFRGDLAWQSTTEAGFRLLLGAGPTAMVPKDGDAELLVDYRLGVGYAVPQVVLAAWFTGRWIATAEDTDFSEASTHQLTVAATGARGRVRPAIYVRLPLDDDLDILKMSLGLGLTFGFQ
jgi:hypothetical protein